MKSRRASIIIKYNNKDISEDLRSYLKQFDYNDVMDGEADDISLTLEDMAELWESDWLPDKGATLEASIVLTDWTEEGTKQLDLGKFELDEIELSGPPHEVKLKGVSVPDNNTLRGVDKNRSWENVKLSKICQDIATDAGLELFYDVNKDPEIDRAEQTEESDLTFLMRVCKDKGYALKVSDNKIIVFDIVTYESKDTVATISREDIISYTVQSKTREVYKACHVKYSDTKTGSTIEYTFTPDDKKTGKTLAVNEQVASVAEAEELAKKKLREKNSEEITLSLTMLGNIDLYAGATVNISGFHKFDGKYIITTVKHSIGGGYQSSLDLRRCLNGY
jgi:uncharacterized protein